MSPDVRLLRFNLTNFFFFFLLLNSDFEQEIETKTSQEEHVIIWNETTPKAQDDDEANLRTLPEDVPCVRLMARAIPAPAHELQGNSKRPRISTTGLYPQLTKPATSSPAMIIPHLVSHGTTTPPGPVVFHN